MSDEPLQRIGPPGTVTLTKTPVSASVNRRRMTQDEAVESATEAAFDRHVANQVHAGKMIAASWSDLTDAQKREWRSIITEAIMRWCSTQEER